MRRRRHHSKPDLHLSPTRLRGVSGNWYPYRDRQSLAFLHRRPKDLEEWKAEARAKVFELLAYQPEPCDPQAQILERVDKGDYVRERLTFRTAPDVEVPAYVPIPKRAKFPVPAVVALYCTAVSITGARRRSLKRKTSTPRWWLFGGVRWPEFSCEPGAPRLCGGDH